MQNIDFLPNRYREQNAIRKVQLWRLTVLALFVAGIGATALGQYSFRRAARGQLAAIGPQHASARAKTEQFGQLAQQLKEVQSVTQLYAYLDHPWPRTQILSGVAEKLPASLTLSELRIAREATPVETNDPRRSRRPRAREGTDEEGKEKLSAAMRDLKRLREEFDAGRTVVEVSGLTHDIAALHTYAAHLADVPLFAKCELASLESVGEAKSNSPERGQSRFKLRLVLRPGYGQPGSQSPAPPRESMAAADRASQEHTP